MLSCRSRSPIACSSTSIRRAGRLQAPIKAKVQEQIQANFEWAFNHHRAIVEQALTNPENAATITEAQRSLDAMAKLMGWYKPDKIEASVHGFADSLDRAFALLQANRTGINQSGDERRGYSPAVIFSADRVSLFDAAGDKITPGSQSYREGRGFILAVARYHLSGLPCEQ
jgi:hypothetical protein